MKTLFLLWAEFETAIIPLSSISKEYLGLSPQMAAQKAICGELPLVTFRVGNTQKAPRMVHIRDLAEHIDREIANAKKERLRMGVIFSNFK